MEQISGPGVVEAEQKNVSMMIMSLTGRLTLPLPALLPASATSRQRY